MSLNEFASLTSDTLRYKVNAIIRQFRANRSRPGSREPGPCGLAALVNPAGELLVFTERSRA